MRPSVCFYFIKLTFPAISRYISTKKKLVAGVIAVPSPFSGISSISSDDYTEIAFKHQVLATEDSAFQLESFRFCVFPYKRTFLCVFILGVLVKDRNRELKKRRRERQRKRHLKVQLYFICATLRLFQLAQLLQKRRTIQAPNW